MSESLHLALYPAPYQSLGVRTHQEHSSGARYDMGLSRIVDDPNRDLKNQSIMVMAGFLFRFPGM